MSSTSNSYVLSIPCSYELNNNVVRDIHTIDDINELLELKLCLYDNREIFETKIITKTDSSQEEQDLISNESPPSYDNIDELSRSVSKAKALLRENIERYIYAKKELYDRDVECIKYDREMNHVVSLNDAILKMLSDKASTEEASRTSQVINDAIQNLKSIKQTYLKTHHEVSQYMNASLDEKRRLLETLASRVKNISNVFGVHKNLSTFYSCPICFTREVTHFFNPCGHTYCNTCARKLQSNKCFICNKKVIQINPLYMC